MQNPNDSLMKRVLLKVSGEVLQGQQAFGLDPLSLNHIADDIAQVRSLGVEVVCVVGGGNFIRGAQCKGMPRASADTMGMLATVINALALGEALNAQGCEARVMSAIAMPQVCEPYVQARAERHIQRGRVLICAAGINHPFFTTDTAATLRAIELHCDALCKGTKFAGIYDLDPALHPEARRFVSLTYSEVLARGLKVMDATAITLAQEYNMPIVVFSIRDKGAFKAVLTGGNEKTLVCAG